MAAASSPSPLAERTVAIVGLGLMGSSLGLALAGRVERRIGVSGPDPEDATAIELGAVDEMATLADAASAADIVVLAAPVRAVEQLVPRVAAAMRTGSVLTDVASVKGPVVRAMDGIDTTSGVAAVGGHPMCGSEQHGASAARAELFTGAMWVVTPTARATPEATTTVEALAHSVGALPLVVGAARHDELVALASHLPYAVAQALVHELAADEAARTVGATARDLVAGGMRDATRLAAGSVEMWRDILATNAGPLRAALQGLRVRLDELESMLEDPIALDRWLRDGQRSKRTLAPGHAGASGPR